MPRRSFTSLTRFAVAVTFAGLLSAGATAGERKSPITKLTVDPEARQVELFEAIEEGELDVRMIPKDAKGGNLFIENTTDEPLTVNMPAGFVGVQTFKQIGGLGGGLGGGGLGGGGLGGGGGFFSIPAETVARVPYGSVCLEHGKPEPMPRMTYQVVPVEAFTENETLQALIALVGTGKLDSESAQAAAWHLSDGMSWAEIANLKHTTVDGFHSRPYFAPGKVAAAQSLVSIAAARAREIAAAEEAGTTTDAVSTETPAKTPQGGRIR